MKDHQIGSDAAWEDDPHFLIVCKVTGEELQLRSEPKFCPLCGADLRDRDKENYNDG